MRARELPGRHSGTGGSLHGALAGGAQGLCLVGADFRIVAWNETYRELLDYPDGLLAVGRPFADLLRHDIERGVYGQGDVAGLTSLRLRLARTTAPEALTRRRQDGRLVELRSCPLADGGFVQLCAELGGAPVVAPAAPAGAEAAAAAGRQALPLAPRTQRQLADALGSFAEGLALFDADGRLTFANDRYRDFYAKVAADIVPGIRREALIHRKVEGGVFADDGGSLADLVRWYGGLHRKPDDFFEIRLADGRWLRLNDRRSKDGGIVSLRADISEIKERELALVRVSEELRTQNLRFDAALNNMIQGLCMFDAGQRLIVCNERYLQMYGFSPEVVKPGIALREIMEYSVSLGNYRSEDAAQAIAERPTHAARREQATLLQRLTDGRVIAVMHQPMADGGSVATYEDVTQAVRAEEALRDYAGKLERSNRELQDFASVASHDLQEPLRKIEAFGDRLKAKCAADLSETGQMYIDRMQNAAGRMRALINDLLAYSRITTKARPFVEVDLDMIAAEVCSDLQVSIEQAEGRVEVGPLPRIEADPTQIRQLLQNLVSNALKFRRPDVAPVVSLSGRLLPPEEPGEPPTHCELLCADNGIGFEQKYADRIFGIFQRLHGRNEFEGTGIGLATCRKIVERHGGRIAAQGVPGEGAAFAVTLPVRQPIGDPVP